VGGADVYVRPMPPRHLLLLIRTALALRSALATRPEDVVHALTRLARASVSDEPAADEELRRAPHVGFHNSKMDGQAREAVAVSLSRCYEPVSDFEQVAASGLLDPLLATLDERATFQVEHFGFAGAVARRHDAPAAEVEPISVNSHDQFSVENHGCCTGHTWVSPVVLSVRTSSVVRA
jgi:hypothetical protein